MVYVFLANGFEDIEALAPIDILRRAGLEVITAGVSGNEIVSAHKMRFITDINADEIMVNDRLELIVLPGGMPGTLNLKADRNVQGAIDFCADNDKYIGAICAAPSILGQKGLLKGKKATCFPGFEKELIGAEATGEPVVQDGKIITARGAGVCIPFALKLVEVLCGKEKADSLEESLQCIKA